jgi:hypothetical protein
MNFLHDLLCDRENEHVAEPGNMMTGQHVLNGRVERMGAVARAIRQRSVSHPRSSNRTCPIKASGSPTGFTVRHTESKLTARGERVRVSIASPLTRPSPNGGRVGIRIVTFEACSGFTHVTARRIAQPTKATFVTRLQPFRLPGRAARQLPDQSTTLWVDSSSTGNSRLRGAMPTTDLSIATQQQRRHSTSAKSARS